MSFRILKFETIYKPDGNGGMRGIDMVHYAPIGAAHRSVNIEPVSRLGKLQPIEDAGNNMAIKMAHDRWAVVKPAYDAWKAGLAAPVNGTPLAAWPGLTAPQADVLRNIGIRTVEEIAEASDGIIQQIKLPGARELRDNAKRFLSAADRQRASEQMTRVEAENAELKAQLEELRQIVIDQQAASDAEKPRRGRPPKSEVVAAA